MTPSATAMTEMMRIADELEDIEMNSKSYGRPKDNDSRMQQAVQERLDALEKAWDKWNHLILAERIAMV